MKHPRDVKGSDMLTRDGVFMACHQDLIVVLLCLFVFLLLLHPLLIVDMPVLQKLLPSSMASQDVGSLVIRVHDIPVEWKASVHRIDAEP